MALSQQKFREIVFQLLYSQDIGHPEDDLMTELIMGELAVTKKNVRLAQDKVKKIIDHQPDLDRMIGSVSESYDFERIQAVTKNILRLAVFEMLYDREIPPKVSIAEAIRLSRKFNTPESASFVNALLDHIYHNSLGEKGDIQKLEQTTKDLINSEKEASEAANQSKSEKTVELPDDNL